ncbi:MAG: ABC transporter permease [Ruminococcus sp.]|nr:ABC transporter permease [Ruminococcus sp.]MCM1380671.1 ABC transporter permease [Muribaculaceae bacterium]MCM1478467.1 ABC transporter permease [Muribaculaceae bacterium]
MGAIFRRELKAYFTSPIAYIFIAVFYIYTSTFFTNYNLYYGTTDMSNSFTSAFTIIMILLPLLTMRLFTEEKRLKTDQCLLTAPVNLFSIVMGKFLAAVCVFLCAMAIYVLYVITLVALAGTVAWATVIGNFVALLLLGASFISIGIFVSAMTENQVVAAIVSFIIIILFYMIDVFAGSVQIEWLRTAMSNLGFYTRYYEFSTGIFSVPSLVFFLSAIFIFNFLTVRALEKRRWS